jgi:peptidoglycan/LPS O-acetylase OafA/YrhL
VNYFPWNSQSHFVRHIWSLSNEEQFYLLWPFAVALLRPRIALQLAATAIVCLPFVRLAVMLTGGSVVLTLDRRFECVADVLATGCLLAGIQGLLSRNGRYLRFLRSRWFLIVPVVMVASIMTQDHPYPYYLVAQTLANIGIALCIDRMVRFPESVLGRLLNSPPLRYVGALSYSLYLWQQLFLVPESHAWWTAFPVNIALAIAASVISFRWIETPFQRLRSKFSRPAPVMVS